MKRLIFILCLLLSFGFASPDVLVNSKLNYDWSTLLFEKFRLLFRRHGVPDPFELTLNGPFLIHQSTADLMPFEGQRFIRDFGASIGVNLSGAQTIVEADSVSYKLESPKMDFKEAKQLPDGLYVGTDIIAKSLSVKMKSFSFSLKLPVDDPNMPDIKIELINPWVKFNCEDFVSFYAQFVLENYGDYLKFNVLSTDFERMVKNMLDHADDVDFDYDHIIVPDLALRVGKKTLKIYPEKIEALLKREHEAVRGILILHAAEALRKGITDSITKGLDLYKIPANYWIRTTGMRIHTTIGKLMNNVTKDHVGISLPTDFCNNKRFDTFGNDCLKYKGYSMAPSRITKPMHAQSVSTILELMRDPTPKILASISEDFISKMMVATFDAGLWDDALKKADINLGPNMAVMRLDKRGSTGTVYMDMIYRPKGLKKFATGASEIRFPLKAEISLKIQNVKGTAVVGIELHDVDLSDNALLNGFPDVGMLTTIPKVPRFKKQVVKTIRKMVTPLKGTVISMPFPKLNDLGLEFVQFDSDGQGRMNAVLNFEDLILR